VNKWRSHCAKREERLPLQGQRREADSEPASNRKTDRLLISQPRAQPRQQRGEAKGANQNQTFLRRLQLKGRSALPKALLSCNKQPCEWISTAPQQ
jgi:hypothetical protein